MIMMAQSINKIDSILLLGDKYILEIRETVLKSVSAKNRMIGTTQNDLTNRYFFSKGKILDSIPL